MNPINPLVYWAGMLIAFILGYVVKGALVGIIFMAILFTIFVFISELNTHKNE